MKRLLIATAAAMLISTATMASNHPAAGDSSYGDDNSIGTGNGSSSDSMGWNEWAEQNRGYSGYGWDDYDTTDRSNDGGRCNNCDQSDSDDYDRGY